jgi:hypothetical protein
MHDARMTGSSALAFGGAYELVFNNGAVLSHRSRVSTPRKRAQIAWIESSQRSRNGHRDVVCTSIVHKHSSIIQRVRADEMAVMKTI